MLVLVLMVLHILLVLVRFDQVCLQPADLGSRRSAGVQLVLQDGLAVKQSGSHVALC
jgi:hypothetical protein